MNENMHHTHSVTTLFKVMRLAFGLFVLSFFPCKVSFSDDDLANIHWVVMTQSDWFYDQTSFQNLKNIGVQAVIDAIPWRLVEPSNGSFNFAAARLCMNRARAAGLTWIPHIAIHYPPNWLINSDVNFHWIKRDGSYSVFDNDANPPNIFHPQTLFYVNRLINAFYNEFAGESFPVIYLSTGSLGETYYPDGANYCAFDANTIAAWRAYTGNPGAMPYSGPNSGDGSGASYNVFISWWYGKMYDYMRAIYGLANTRRADIPLGLKISHNPGIGQIMEEQVQAVLSRNLKVISFGGPLAQASDGSQKVAQVAHQNGIYGWVESFLGTFNGIDQTPAWTRDRIVSYQLDGYMYAIMPRLITGFLASPPFQILPEYYKYRDLIAMLDGIPPAAVSNLSMLSSGVNYIALRWTAPGDDGASGTASSYDLRFSTSAITAVNFSSATRITGMTAPLSGGSTETFTVNSLAQGTTYYFAIKATDERGNTALISNVVSGATQADSDGDGLSNAQETTYGTNANNVDSDGDGMSDLYEIVAGTNPSNAASYSSSLFSDNFNDGNYTGWSASGAGTISWSANTNALVSTPSGAGYSFMALSSLNISAVSSLAVAYDMTFSNTNDGWGGLWFRGIHLDVNANRCGWRDGSYEGFTGSYRWFGGMTRGVQHHVLVLLRMARPYWLSDLYIDGKPIFTNEPIQAGSFTNNTVGLVSNYSTGTLTYDNFVIWPKSNPMLLPLTENFSAGDFGAWIASGNANIAWTVSGGALTSTVASGVSGTGYGYFEHALLDVSGKDVLMECDVIPQNWGGLLFRGVGLDFNTTRIGWRDGSFEGHPGTYQWYTGLNAGSHHLIMLIQRNSPYDRANLYVDGASVFTNEPIEVNSYPDTTVGFLSNYSTGSTINDNFNVTTAAAGANFAPVLASIGNQRVTAGRTLTFQARAIDPNTSTITYSATGLPSGASINSSTGVFTWTTIESDAGTYTVTIRASDGSLTDTETITITVVVPSSNPGLIYQESFDGASLPAGWVESGAASNVDWTIAANKVQAAVVGAGGYSMLDNTGLNLTSYSQIAMEYDVTFNNSDGWGGVRYRGISLDLNPNRIGWRDGSYEGLPGTYRWFSGVSRGAVHHIIVFIRQASPYYLSDLYVDGKPIFTNEPIQTGSFTNTGMGFLSPYSGGGNNYQVDNIIIKDMTQLLPVGAISTSFDFTNFSNWIISGSLTNINWTLGAGALTASVTGSGGYSFMWPYDLDVSGRDVTIDYDVTFSNASDGWGGLVYRGVHIDICPNRYGVRDGSYEGYSGTYRWYTSSLTKGVSHHVRAFIRNASPYATMTLVVDGATVFSSEPIEVASFPKKSVGFASGYVTGVITLDNLAIAE